MSAAFIANGATFPEGGPLKLEVLNDDGAYGHLYTPNVAEVTLIERGYKNGETLVVSLGFDVLEQAERAGKILADALAAVKAIQAEPKPKLCGFHRYYVGPFDRSLKHSAVCTRCGCVSDLVPRKETPEPSSQPEVRLSQLEEVSTGYEGRWHQHHTLYVHACADCRREKHQRERSA